MAFASTLHLIHPLTHLPRPINMSKRIQELLSLPVWLVEANWLCNPRLGLGAQNETKLQLVHDHGWTHAHRDNSACDTWMKLLTGQVLVACWSQADGIESGWSARLQSQREIEGEDPPPDWELFRRMPSARLFLMSKGDALVMPCGTYHCVCTGSNAPRECHHSPTP